MNGSIRIVDNDGWITLYDSYGDCCAYAPMIQVGRYVRNRLGLRKGKTGGKLKQVKVGLPLVHPGEEWWQRKDW